jgi:hypothetical protein
LNSVSGQSLATAFQSPNAPSPTADIGLFYRYTQGKKVES